MVLHISSEIFNFISFVSAYKSYNRILIFLSLHIYPLEWLLIRNTSPGKEEEKLELLCTFGEHVKRKSIAAMENSMFPQNFKNRVTI